MISLSSCFCRRFPEKFLMPEPFTGPVGYPQRTWKDNIKFVCACSMEIIPDNCQIVLYNTRQIFFPVPPVPHYTPLTFTMIFVNPLFCPEFHSSLMQQPELGGEEVSRKVRKTLRPVKRSSVCPENRRMNRRRFLIA